MNFLISSATILLFPMLAVLAAPLGKLKDLEVSNTNSFILTSCTAERYDTLVKVAPPHAHCRNGDLTLCSDGSRVSWSARRLKAWEILRRDILILWRFEVGVGWLLWHLDFGRIPGGVSGHAFWPWRAGGLRSVKSTCTTQKLRPKSIQHQNWPQGDFFHPFPGHCEGT